MIDLVEEIEAALDEPAWKHWIFKSIKRRVDEDNLVSWAVYIAYEDDGDPRGISIVTRSSTLRGALRDMLILITSGEPQDAPWA